MLCRIPTQCYDVFMRTTLNIDDDLLAQLKQLAHDLRVPLATLLNQTLRKGLRAPGEKRPQFRQKVYSMGVPQIDIDQALSIAAADEDAETVRKLAAGK